MRNQLSAFMLYAALVCNGIMATALFLRFVFRRRKTPPGAQGDHRKDTALSEGEER